METFQKLIFPISAQEFTANNWCKSPLFLSREADYLADLVSIDDVNEYLGLQRLSYPFVKIIKDGSVLDNRRYCHDIQDGYGMIDRRNLFNYFSSGATIALQVSHLTFPNLRAFTHKLEQELGIRVHANLYLTPGNSQGFYPHIDPHEVFALQISGAKKWNIYDRVSNTPATDQQLSSADQERYLKTTPTHTLTMQPGDLLYIPRGVVHDAFTSDGSHSLHITIGVHPLKKIDVVKLMLDRMGQADTFREYLLDINQNEPIKSAALQTFNNEISDLLNETLNDLSEKQNISIRNKYYTGNDHLANIVSIDRINSHDELENLQFETIEPNLKKQNELESTILNRDFSNHQLTEIKSVLKRLLINGAIKLNSDANA